MSTAQLNDSTSVRGASAKAIEKANKEQEEEEEESEFETCTICLEALTNAGKHRAVSLKCGHVFGRRCLKKWLDPFNNTNNRKTSKCPNCNEKASLKDIRPVLLTTSRVVDTAELERANEQIEKLKVELHDAKKAESAVRLQLALFKQKQEEKEIARVAEIKCLKERLKERVAIGENNSTVCVIEEEYDKGRKLAENESKESKHGKENLDANGLEHKEAKRPRISVEESKPVTLGMSNLFAGLIPKVEEGKCNGEWLKRKDGGVFESKMSLEGTVLRNKDAGPSLDLRASKSKDSMSMDSPQCKLVFEVFKKAPVCPSNSCRVMAFDHSSTHVLAVGKKFAVGAMKRGLSHGVSRINIGYLFVRQKNMKGTQASEFKFDRTLDMGIHHKEIRDMEFSWRKDGLLMTASLDKTLKISSMSSSTVVQTYQVDVPVWSCCWSKNNPFELFAGGANGLVYLFDNRYTKGYIEVINPKERASLDPLGPLKGPIASLQYCKKPLDGLVACAFENGQFFHRTDGTVPKIPTTERCFQPFCLHEKGNVISSASYLEENNILLTSFRRSNQRIEHQISKFCYDPAKEKPAKFEMMASFSPENSSACPLLRRSAVFKDSVDNLYCAGSYMNADKPSISIWDANTKEVVQTLQTDALAIDLVYLQQQSMLVALSKSSLTIYQGQR
eukprot:Nk52_evm51s224 gene=Nk52_evmTU51s224